MSTPSDQRQTFSPLMSPDRDYEEINTYVVCWGLFFGCCSRSPSAIWR